MKTNQNCALTLVSILIVIASGCKSADERLIELSQSNAEHQAEHNVQMASQSQSVADAAQLLVAADAQARTEMIQAQQSLQQQLQAERQSLDRQHAELETDRRAWATVRHRDPIIAGAISGSALLLGCLLPLLVCVFVLRATPAA